MGPKQIGGKRWTPTEKDANKLTRKGDDGEILKISLVSAQGYTQCGGTEDSPCDYYRPIRKDCPVCGKARPTASSKESTAKANKVGAVSDDDVKLITSLVLAAQLNQYPTKPERKAPTASDFAAAVKADNDGLLEELADLQDEWDKYQSFSAINTRILNRYKKVIDSVIGTAKE